jgi:hypothetical protein
VVARQRRIVFITAKHEAASEAGFGPAAQVVSHILFLKCDPLLVLSVCSQGVVFQESWPKNRTMVTIVVIGPRSGVNASGITGCYFSHAVVGTCTLGLSVGSQVVDYAT